MRSSKKYALFGSMALGIVYAVVYGVLAHAALDWKKALPTFAFLILVPTAMGAIPLLFSYEEHITNYALVLLVPWLSIASFLGLLVAIGREGALCFIVLGSPLILAALLGTLIAFFIRAILIGRRRKAAGVALMLFPFVVASVEQRTLVREEMVEVASETIVAEQPKEVWSRLAAFEAIDESEYRAGLFNFLGVPRPIRAEVDHAGLGGRRTGHFEHGLVFDEVITEFDPPRRMSFSIDVDPRALRQSSMERHALEGGYFRFVDATYALSPLEDGKTRVVLSSRYVAKSSVNLYGNLWARAIVTDFQDRVLDVIRRRASDGPRKSRSPIAGR